MVCPKPAKLSLLLRSQGPDSLKGLCPKVPRTISHGPDSFKRQGPMVPIAWRDKVPRSPGPWDLVPWGYRDIGTLSLEAIGTLGPCPLKLLGPWHLWGYWDLGTCPNSLKGQGPKVPGTMSQGPDSLKEKVPRSQEPWDLVPSGYRNHGTLGHVPKPTKLSLLLAIWLFIKCVLFTLKFVLFTRQRISVWSNALSSNVDC